MYDFPPQTLYNLIYSAVFSSKVGIGNVISSFYENSTYYYFYFDLKSHPRLFRVASIWRMVVVIYCILCDYCWRIMYDNCACGRYITKSFLHVFRINTTINRQWAIEFARCRRSWRCYI